MTPHLLPNPDHHVVIIGGGFGGLYAAKALRRAPVQVTLVDKRNFHLFQPLLYQVATGGISPGNIATALRHILRRHQQTRTLAAEVVDILPDQRRLILSDGELTYDTLIVATGVHHHYFGRDEWAGRAPGLKTIEDALEMRRRIFLAFEAAEREADPGKRRAWLTFVVVGGGPTGVELAGALGELAHNTLKHDFRRIDPAETQIILLEGLDRILPTYPPALSAKATAALSSLGVTVQTGVMVTEIEEGMVKTKGREGTIGTEGIEGTSASSPSSFSPFSSPAGEIAAQTVLWAAGVQASAFATVLAQRTHAPTDPAGRLIVQPDLSVPGYPEILVIGDVAHYAHQTGRPLPGVAQVAMQQGAYTARLVQARLQGPALPPFRYRDKGSLAVIGRNRAVADLGRWRLSGFLAWLAWAFIHISYLIEFDSKLLVLTQWAWAYFTHNRGARLITGEHLLPRLESPQITQIDAD
ncbi:MAG: NAD(P)/FAD-dependent oxidoreductase [Chloroflexota bacterium]